MGKTDIKTDVKRYFAGQRDIECVYLFGSTVAGKTNKFSDVDVAVLFDRKVDKETFGERALAIVDELSRFLDKNVDVVVLNRADSFLKFQIIKNGLKIFEQPGRSNHSFEADSIVEYFDFLPVRKRLEEALIGKIKETT